MSKTSSSRTQKIEPATSAVTDAPPRGEASPTAPAGKKGASARRYDDGLPRSVRYAPAELRPEIRRRQNNESSRRFRERRASHIQSMQKMYETNRERIDDLERVVSKLSDEISSTRSQEAAMKASRISDGFYGAPF